MTSMESETEPLMLEQSEYAPVDLCERSHSGLTVILYWLKATNSIHICLIDEYKQDTEFFQVPNDKALDAFRHPYAYKYAQD